MNPIMRKSMHYSCDAYPAGAGPVDPGADEGRHGGHEALEAGAQRDPVGDGDVVAVEGGVHHVQVDDVQLACNLGRARLVPHRHPSTKK